MRAHHLRDERRDYRIPSSEANHGNHPAHRPRRPRARRGRRDARAGRTRRLSRGAHAVRVAAAPLVVARTVNRYAVVPTRPARTPRFDPAERRA